MKGAQSYHSDQIAELTRGVTLPLPPVGDDVLAFVLEAIAEAWEHLKKNFPHVVANGDEKDISALLVNRLNGSLGWDSTLGLFVSSVERGSETVNFDGKKLETRPDLHFTLTKQDPRFRLLGESKIIDAPKKKTPALYRAKGIARFICGDYAWASQEALMVGYVRCNAKLAPSLLNGLTKIAAMQCTAQSGVVTGNPPIRPDGLGRSSHTRTFSYVHGTTSVPGPIELWHLWLS